MIISNSEKKYRIKYLVTLGVIESFIGATLWILDENGLINWNISFCIIAMTGIILVIIASKINVKAATKFRPEPPQTRQPTQK